MASSIERIDTSLARVRTDRRTLAILAVLVAIGVVLLEAGERSSDAHHPIWRAILLSLGGLIVASATLSLVWQLAGQRRFAQEVLAAAGVAADVRRAGLRAISDEYLDIVDWPELFHHSAEIDLLASWGITWRRRYERQWIEWIQRPNVHLRVLLPDVDNDELVRHLAHRFNKEAEYVRERVTETATFYRGLATNSGSNTSVTVRHVVRAPVWAYYRMGFTSIVTLYPASLASTPGVPAMVFDDRGETGKFFRSQFDSCWDDGK